MAILAGVRTWPSASPPQSPPPPRTSFEPALPSPERKREAYEAALLAFSYQEPRRVNRTAYLDQAEVVGLAVQRAFSPRIPGGNASPTRCRVITYAGSAVPRRQ